MDNLLHFLAGEQLYILSGLLVGVLVGLTGVGGGSLMTPLLILLFGVHPSTAVGTDLLYAAVTKTVGSTVHHSRKSVDWRVVRRLATGSIPATVIVLIALSHFGVDSKPVARVLSLTLGLVLLVSCVLLLLRNRILAWAVARDPDFGQSTSVRLTIVTGFVVGALVSLSSVGAGALGTIALMALYPRMPLVRVVGTDIAHAVPLTLLAGLGHWALGSINPSLLVALLTGSIPGIIIGSYAVRFTPEAILRPVLATVLGLVGLKMLAPT